MGEGRLPPSFSLPQDYLEASLRVSARAEVKGKGTNMKKIAIACALAVLIALAGCASGTSGASSSSSSSKDLAPRAGESKSYTSNMTIGEPEFDGSAFTDTGEGTMVLKTAGGTSEGGNVPEIPAVANGASNLGLDLEGGDGSVCTLYVDGVSNDKFNFAERSTVSFTVVAEQLHEGVHTVELVKMDGDVPVIYKKAEYKCV